jgi:hypothetical protein
MKIPLSSRLLGVSIGAAAAHAHVQTNSDYATIEQQVIVIVDQLIGDQRHTFERAVVVSPRCWQSAIALVQKAEQYLNAESAATLCASLPEAHQKRLALEIAQCHMQDLGKPFYENTAIETLCTTSSVDFDTVQMCLKHLTDAGENSYTHYITYVQILCTRKTQELFLRYQQEVKDDITSTYAKISGQSIEHMKAISRISQTHAEQMKTLSEIPSMVKDHLTNDLKDQ